MLKKINTLVVTTLILSACSNPSVTPNEATHSATGGDPLPSGTILIDPNNPASPPPVIGSESFSGGSHRVAQGETLFSLAKRYRVTVQQLMSWNRLSSPSALKVGQLLRVHSSNAKTVAPIVRQSSAKSKTYHTVKKGETLYRLARLYRQNVGNLAKWNGLRKSSRLKVGQKLRVHP